MTRKLPYLLSGILAMSFSFAGIAFSSVPAQCGEEKPTVNTDRTKLDNAGLPTDRFSMIEVLLLSTTFPPEKRAAIQAVYNARAERQLPIVDQLNKLWLAEITDYPELIKCGLQSEKFPVPPALNSHDEQIEKFRVQGYAQLSGYVSPTGPAKVAHEHTLEYYREQETPLIDQLNKLLNETDQQVKNLLSAEERGQLQGIRAQWAKDASEWNQRIRSGSTVPVQPANSGQTATPLREKRSNPGLHRPRSGEHQYTSRVDLTLKTNTDLYFAPYLRVLSYRLGNTWMRLRNSDLGNEYKATSVMLTLDKAGNYSNAVMVASSGDSALDTQVMQAVKSSTTAGILDRPPLGAPDEVQVLAKCEYNAVPPKFGEVSVKTLNNKGVAADSYAAALKRTIEKYWFPPRLGANSRDTTITYLINKNGEPVNFSIVRSSGEIELDQSALDAAKAVFKDKQPPLPAGAEKLDAEVTLHLDAVTGERQSVTQVNGGLSDKDIDRYVLDIRHKMQKSWHAPASAGSKQRRVSYNLRLINEIGYGTTTTFKSGDQDSDLEAWSALSGAAFNTPRPEGLPVGTEFSVTFDYDLPQKHK